MRDVRTAPTLSVVLFNYNHGRFLRESISAILGQSLRPTEFIVIDDGSTDNSVEIIESFVRQDPLVRLVRNDVNRGVLYCCARALELASGDYYYPAAADDWVLPGLFEKSLGLLGDNAQAGLCSALMRVVDESGTTPLPGRLPLVATSPTYLPAAQVRQMLRTHGSWLGGNTVMYRREAVLAAGGYIAELESYADHFMSLIVALKYGACFIPEPLATQRAVYGGFNYTIMANLERYTRIFDLAQSLMEGRYRDLFLPELHVQLLNAQRYHVGVASYRRLERQQQLFLKQLLAYLPGSAQLDKAAIRSLGILGRVQGFLVKFYLYARFGRLRLRRLVERRSP